MKKRVLAVMLAGGMVLGAQTGVWAASDTSNQKEGELTLLLTNTLIDGSGANSEEFKKVIHEHVDDDKPFLGVCLGQQVLMDSSEESPDVDGLKLFEGHVQLLWRVEVQIL